MKLSGIKVIDEQHAHLLTAVETAKDMLQNEPDVSVLINFLFDAKDYAEIHFAQEEEVMRQYSYFDYDNHCAVHKKFMDTVDEVLSKAMQEQHVPQAVLTFFEEWLVDHIDVEAEMYSHFFPADY